MAGAMVGPIIQGAMSTVGTIFNSIAGIKADKKLSELIEKDPKYTVSPTLGLANTILNARMKGATERERSIYGTQAAKLSNINKNATDSSQALALAAGVGGQTDAEFDNLTQMENQDATNRRNDWYKITDQEHQNTFDDSVRRWQDQVNTVMTQYKMRRQGGNDWSQMGAAGASMGGGMMGGK